MKNLKENTLLNFTILCLVKRILGHPFSVSRETGSA